MIGGLVFWSLLVVVSPLEAGEEPHPLHVNFVRGDVNADGGITLPDAITLLNFLFTPGSEEPPCLDAADIDDDEALGLPDPINLLNYMFTSGSPPEPPQTCGPDPTLAVALSCNEFPACSDVVDIDIAGHLMRRMGFGPTPEGIEYIQSIGVDAYIQEQLFPELIDESGNLLLNQLLPPNPDSDLVDLVNMQVVRAFYSERQLNEALTDFWENHFNDDFFKIRNLLQNFSGFDEAQAEATNWEYAENELIRDGALGSFLDLLEANASGRTMLVYLDGIFNIAEGPNENYSRELLELHTMGVDNGYTQIDIEQIARCFTGWTICKKDPLDVGDPHAPCLGLDDPAGVWDFVFNPGTHDYGTKVIFAGTSYSLVIPFRPIGSPEGILDGFEVLAHLNSLSQTADFVSGKLIQRLVSDEIPPALLLECRNKWLETGGDLRQVVEVILESEEFLGRENRWVKLMTPMEFVMANCRSVGALTSGGPLLFGVGDPFASLIGLNYIPFIYPTPEGRSELGFDWMGSTNLLNRIKFSTNMAALGADPLFDPVQVMMDEGVPLTDAGEIADFWLKRAFQHHYTVAERDLVIDFLATDTNGVPDPLDPGELDYDARIRAAVGFILSAPQAQLQ